MVSGVAGTEVAIGAGGGEATSVSAPTAGCDVLPEQASSSASTRTKKPLTRSSMLNRLSKANTPLARSIVQPYRATPPRFPTLTNQSPASHRRNHLRNASSLPAVGERQREGVPRRRHSASHSSAKCLTIEPTISLAGKRCALCRSLKDCKT